MGVTLVILLAACCLGFSASLASAQAELGSLEQKLSVTREQLTERTGTVRSAAKDNKPDGRKRVTLRRKGAAN